MNTNTIGKNLNLFQMYYKIEQFNHYYLNILYTLVLYEVTFQFTTIFQSDNNNIDIYWSWHFCRWYYLYVTLTYSVVDIDLRILEILLIVYMLLIFNYFFFSKYFLIITLPFYKFQIYIANINPDCIYY